MFATDLCILFMPIPILWQLNMPIRKKFAISMIAMSGKWQKRNWCGVVVVPTLIIVFLRHCRLRRPGSEV